MKKVLIAVDDTKGSSAILSLYHNFIRPPEEIILLYVEELEGKSLMTKMLGDAELSTLKEMLEGTEYKEDLDKNARKILDYYRNALKNGGLVDIKTVVKEGNPVEEILGVAEEEDVELIIIGSNGKKGLNKLITGCVSRDVEKRAKVPVIIAKTEL